MKRIVFGVFASIIATTILSHSVFAKIANCVGEGNNYPNLSTQSSSKYPVKCPINFSEDGQSVSLYGKSSGDCASAGTIATNPDSCDGEDDAIEDDENKKEKSEMSLFEIILICGLCSSVTLNIVFIILLVKKSKKNVVVVNQAESLAQSNNNNDIYPTPNNN